MSTIIILQKLLRKLGLKPYLVNSGGTIRDAVCWPICDGIGSLVEVCVLSL